MGWKDNLKLAAMVSGIMTLLQLVAIFIYPYILASLFEVPVESIQTEMDWEAAIFGLLTYFISGIIVWFILILVFSFIWGVLTSGYRRIRGQPKK